MRSRVPIPGSVGAHRAFSLVELIVAMSVLVLIMLIVIGLTNQVSSVWKRTSETITAFEGARAADEAMTQNLAQATLNTYWNYDKPKQPTKYLRASELHFMCGPATDVIGNVSNREIVTHAVFFSAPLGFVDGKTGPDLDALLNGMGYFVEFGDDTDSKPPFLSNLNPRYRFRLKQFKQRSEDLEVYKTATGSEWFTEPLQKAGQVRTIAENVIALVLVPKDYDGKPLATVKPLVYDSRIEYTGPQPAESNQLPPVVGVTMVILSETSALRLADQNGSSRPDLVSGSAFTDPDPSVLEADLKQLEDKLMAMRLDYRVLSTNIVIKGAKWSR